LVQQLNCYTFCFRQTSCDAQRIGAILFAQQPPWQRIIDHWRDEQQRALSFDTLRMYLPFGGTRPAPSQGNATRAASAPQTTLRLPRALL
jgi:hypothetical protein